MSTNNSIDTTHNEIDTDSKSSGTKHILSKFEYDLYKEEEDIQLPIIRVKYFSLPNKGERWKVFENNAVVFVIEGSKLNVKEKEFLRTIDGANFLIGQQKLGIKSFSRLKAEIKKRLKKPLTRKK